ncbi:hypothetical protein INR79_09060 [Vibrio sp. SCSIO 43132]|uniref:hypothetical protein n=1 Tax=Vibrio sp. SCSIO 43132 TaxID=2779363 RepID=UPI001CA8ACF3|nr:hypothetical protein [Vibrio sp. SCSIO 43132]UAB68701.1 hypothetical protein INR79_09060 [Vibrio sp. SCSIO 43132]
MILPKKSSLIVDYEKIKRDTFILLNLGYGLNRFQDDDEGDVRSRSSANIFLDYGHNYEAIVSEKLISISISARILDDKISKIIPTLSASNFSFEEFIGDDSDGNLLNLRQCFNKVIHSVSMEHELLHLPEIYLSGEHTNCREWHVRIFILPFCSAVYQWLTECANA